MSDFLEQAREFAARRIERRNFLKGAFGIGALAALESSKIARALVGASAGLPDPKNSGIDTIVLTMMENRSLDHYLGWMGTAIDGVQEGFIQPTKLQVPGCPGGPATNPTVYPVADATTVTTYRMPTHCLGSDPDHGWNGSREEFNGGAMNGFMSRSGADAMGYYKADDIPFLAWLATNYTTFSRYFSSVLGPTFPNRRYWVSGNGGQRDPNRAGDTKGNDIPTPTFENPQPTGHPWPTIFHQLDAAGIPWTYYHSDLATVMLFFNRVTANPGKVRFIADYFVDAAAGLLTPVVFVDPSFYVWGNDDHPAHDVMWGQRYLSDTFLALAQGPQWWNPATKTGAAYIVTWDEPGGFFDHVPPPRVYDPDASVDHCEDWGRLGFRVPTVVASPFTRQGPGGGGMVAQNLFDHTSMLKFLQWRFELGSLSTFTDGVLNLGSRDLAPEIHNLNEVFDFDPANAHPEFASEPPEIPLHALQGLGCAASPVPEGNGGENPLEGSPDVNLPPLALPRRPELATINGKYAGPHAEWVELADAGFFGKFDFRERAKDGVFRD
ncbi:MAG: alkaline phosphatase family protein [Actinomycetota bacterium]